MASLANGQTLQEDGWTIEDPVNPSAGTNPPESAKPTMPITNATALMPELRSELTLEYPTVVMEECNLQAVLSVVAPPVAETARAPLCLVAVLDKSGSMRGEKLQLVVKTLKFMLRHLSERDALGLVAYGTEVNILAPLTYCNAEGRARLDMALTRLKAGTQTNLSGGFIQGLELHKRGVPMAKTAQQQQLRLQFGNKYERLTQEEAQARGSNHFGRYPAPEGAERIHAWTMEMRFERAEDAALVQKVVYTLHETFAEPVVEVIEAPFKLTRLGWGTFTVCAAIHSHDGRIIQLEHDLCFDQPEKFRTVLLPLQGLSSPLHDALQAVDVSMPQETGMDGSVRSTFLFTDGLANVGITDPAKMCSAARAVLEDLGQCRCTVSTFGFGADHNADLLKNLADIGEGIYNYVENEDQIGQAFGESLGGLLTTTHQNVRLSLELQPSISSVRTFTVYPVEGPTVKDDGSQVVTIVLGDLFAEERRDILISLKLPAADIEGVAKIGHVRARGFSVLNTCFENTAQADLSVDRQSLGDLMTAAYRHPQVMLHQNRHLVTKALEDVRARAQGGDLGGARRLLEVACEALSASPLTIQGDADCLGLLADLNDCKADLRRDEDFRHKGSKKMACMAGAHGRQRGCGQDYSEKYTNNRMHSMKMAFKERVKEEGNTHSFAANQSSMSSAVPQFVTHATHRLPEAPAGAGSATAGYPAENTALANFFQNLPTRGQSGAAPATTTEGLASSSTAVSETMLAATGSLANTSAAASEEPPRATETGGLPVFASSVSLEAPKETHQQ